MEKNATALEVVTVHFRSHVARDKCRWSLKHRPNPMSPLTNYFPWSTGVRIALAEVCVPECLILQDTKFERTMGSDGQQINGET